MKLVMVPYSQSRDKSFPNARVVVSAIQDMVLNLPAVEVADYRHVLGIGCPDTKLETSLTILFCRMDTEMLVEAAVRSLAEKVDIMLTKKGMRKYGSCKIYRAPPGCAPSSRDDRAPASSDRLKGGLEPSRSWPA